MLIVFLCTINECQLIGLWLEAFNCNIIINFNISDYLLPDVSVSTKDLEGEIENLGSFMDELYTSLLALKVKSFKYFGENLIVKRSIEA